MKPPSQACLKAIDRWGMMESVLGFLGRVKDEFGRARLVFVCRADDLVEWGGRPLYIEV